MPIRTPPDAPPTPLSPDVPSVASEMDSPAVLASPASPASPPVLASQPSPVSPPVLASPPKAAPESPPVLAIRCAAGVAARDPDARLATGRTEKFAVGDGIEARFEGKATYYAGKITEVTMVHAYSIAYDDGDREDGRGRGTIRVYAEPTKDRWVHSEDDVGRVHRGVVGALDVLRRVRAHPRVPIAIGR